MADEPNPQFPIKQSKDAIRAQFRMRSSSYDDYTAWSSDERIAAEIARPLGHLKRDAWCIDIGAGTGSLGEYLSRVTGKWIFIDLSEAMLRRRYHRYSVVGDAESLPFATKSVDAAVARSVLAYVDPAILVNESKRVLKDDGLLVVAEKVLGDYTGEASEWYRELQELRNPLKGSPLETHEVAAMVQAAGLKLVSSIEFRRTYTYRLEEWVTRMGTIDSAAHSRILQLLNEAPLVGGEKGITIDGDEIYVPLSWAIICGRREDRKTEDASLIATVLPVRLSAGRVEIYMQERLEPVYREPEYIGMLEFPQGHVEVSETIREAAARELREESGMEIVRILSDSEEHSSGIDGRVIWDGFDHAGLVRARGRLNFVAVWLVAEVRSGALGGKLNNVGRWLTMPKAMTAVQNGTVYPLNAPMVRAMVTIEEDIRQALMN